MSGELSANSCTITGENAPAILVLVEVVQAYMEASDPAGIGSILFEVTKAVTGKEYSEPKEGAQKSIFRRLLAAAERGIESYRKMQQRGRKGADASNAARRAAAKPAPKPAPMADGGARRAEDGEGGGVDIGSLAYRDPLTAALLATGETGNARARNTFKKLLREKGARRFRDAVISFEAECRSGEVPNNRGAALTRRLKDLPNDPKGGEA